MRMQGARSSRGPGSGAGRAGLADRERGPIRLFPRVGDDRWPDRALARVTWAFVALGVAIRLLRFAMVHPLWGDECFVGANLIARGYLGLLRPLDYQQVVPILFLWLEKAAIGLLGFSVWSPRVVPTAASIGALFAFRHLATRLMGGLPLLMGVAIVAVAINPIRHGGEAKPYATDFLVSAVVLAMVVEWWRRPDRSVWLWALAAATPLATGLSLPAVFVLGGAALAIAPAAWRARGSGVSTAFVGFVAALVASAAAGSVLYGGVREAGTRAYMEHYWSANFPPLDRPAGLILWLVRAHTGHLAAYPAGGANGASLLTAAFAAWGAVDLFRRGRGAIVGACLAPLGLALAASAIRAYPYGESERLMQFAGPMVCLLAGHGLARAIGRLRRPGSYRRASVAALVAFGSIGVGTALADFLLPAKTVHDLRAREFARWFWPAAGRDAELACARVDLGLDFEGGPTHHGRSADYLCYQQIYSSRRGLPGPPDWARASASRPLRVVFYDGVPADSELFGAWMARMARHYTLGRVETFRVNAGVAPKGLSFEDHLAVLDFVPIGPPVDPAALAAEAREAVDRPDRGTLSLPGPR